MIQRRGGDDANNARGMQRAINVDAGGKNRDARNDLSAGGENAMGIVSHAGIIRDMKKPQDRDSRVVETRGRGATHIPAQRITDRRSYWGRSLTSNDGTFRGGPRPRVSTTRLLAE